MATRPSKRIIQIKRPDTLLLLGVFVLLIAVGVCVHLLAPEAVTTVLLVLCTVFLAGLALDLHRRRETAAIQQIRQVQALIGVYSILRPRRPLPSFTGWAASPELVSTLVTLILQHRPQHVMELGSGASTIVAAYALDEIGSGRITALDHDATYAAHTRDELEKHNLDGRADVVTASLVGQEIDGEAWDWYELGSIRHDDLVDLLIVDGPPRETRATARYPALPVLHPRLAANAIVVLDDAYRDDEQEILQRWLKRYPEFRLTYQESGKGIAVLWRESGAEKTND